VQELLVIKPSSLGDVIHALRVMASVKEELPETRISWVVRDSFVAPVRDCGFVERVFEFRRGGGPFAYLRLIREIRRQDFDCVLEMQGLLRSAVLAAAAKAPVKWGRRDGREGATLFYAKVPFPLKPTVAHAIDVLLAFKDVIGLKTKLTGELRFPGASLSEENTGILNDVTRGGALPLVALFPESRRSEKEWSEFAELAKQLSATGELAVAWAGEKVGGEPKGLGVANLGGKTSLAELPALIKCSSVVVANDSAPLHYASALERPVVGLFGPTSPRRFGPYPVNSLNARIIRAPAGDLDRLGVDDVKKAVLKLLDGV